MSNPCSQSTRRHLMSREIGSLRTLSNGESQYVGSASGVYFINTVRRAFAISAAGTRGTNDDPANGSGETPVEARENPSPEDCIVGEGQQDGGSRAQRESELGTHSVNGSDSVLVSLDWLASLRRLPDRSVARQLILSYFRIWHPLVPFLHGPSILAGLDTAYDEIADTRNLETGVLARLVIYKCIFSVAALDHDLSRSDVPVIRSPSEIWSALGPLTLRCDTQSTQALLAAEVYLIATMALRSASSVGGLTTKAIVQSGMHRCPFRYGHLSPDDRTMRKRIFWSAYVLDRFLSQSLGHPLGIQDSDIDVCLPGSRDLHEPVAHSALSPANASADNTILHLAVNHPERCAASPRLQARNRDLSSEEEDAQNTGANQNFSDRPSTASPNRTEAIQQHRRESQAVLDHHVRYSQLIGRMLEIYHKSIHTRGVDDRTIVFLKADVSAWGNMLNPPQLNTSWKLSYDVDLGPDPTIFPLVSYKYARLLINRPSLSLDPVSADFRNSIQVCVGAASTIIQVLEAYSKSGGPLFWPGYMSAVWMSGLVLAFAAQLNQFTITRAALSISSALNLLEAMKKRWRMAGHCKEVLAIFLDKLQSNSKGHKRRRNDELGPRGQEISGSVTEMRRPSKRVAVGSPNGTASPSLRNGLDPAQPAFHGDSHTPSRTKPSSCGHNQQPVQEQNFPETDAYHIYSPDFVISDLITPQDGSSQIHKYPQLSQPDFNFDFFSLDDPGNPSVTEHLGQFHVPIPTTFPDRHRSQQHRGINQMSPDMTYNVFDGATWGSLIDLVGENTE